MNILYWFLVGLIFAFLIMQLERGVEDNYPNEYKQVEWVVIILSIICPPIGFIVCFIGCFFYIQKLILEKTNLIKNIKSILNFLLKERKL